MLKALQSTSLLAGGNAAWLEQQYENYLRDPNSVEAAWRDYFEKLPLVNGSARDIPHSDVRAHFSNLARHSGRRPASSISAEGLNHAHKQIGVTQLINAYRVRGHQLAKIDPLGRNRKKHENVREVELHEYGLSAADSDTQFSTPALHGVEGATLAQIVDRLEQTYCSSVGYEFMYVDHTTQKEWLLQRIESVSGKPTFTAEQQTWLLDRLTAAEGLEKYLHSKYVGQKRFSLEGGESLIVILSELVRRTGESGVKELVIGMSHRGRLNVLVNIMGKNPEDLFSEFEGKKNEALSAGDVKYHMGFSSDLQMENGHDIHLTLAFNPSHLEIVSPVVEGSVRSRQDSHGDAQGDQVVPVVVHGDAAFAGQGVVMETFNMAESRGYSTKGTVHIVVNNQIGFTTSNLEDARSTEYCTDVAKMINAPIFHVNGDDPEAVLFVTQVALDFRMQFKKDVVIDLVCYRRHGHNEADEPSATQPEMYKVIRKLPTTRKLYAQQLEAAGVLPVGDGDARVSAMRDALDDGKTIAPLIKDNTMSKTAGVVVDWSPYVGVTDWRTPGDTRVNAADLKRLGEAMTTVPDGHKLHPRVAKIYEDRRKMTAGAVPMDWGYAENLAYATLADDDYRVRITGQDCGRGTFFHRHAVLHSQVDGSTYVPLRNLGHNQPRFLVIDSVLSEEAVMAFEYGYATHDPRTLVIWEAQFGDFANGAQMVIDQFISSGEAKWGRLCGLTLLLPHGYEGQGPEHSSARVERFLQLCAEDNMQVMMPSTPAQCFHMLRQQMVRPLRRPLIVFTPKSLLRHRLAVSTLDELTDGQFQPVIGDIDNPTPENVDRVLLCAGKVYYDILEARREQGRENVAIVRVEQLYPFPYSEVEAAIRSYPNAKDVLWCQEEPRNQGAWRAIRHRIERILQDGQSLGYAGRAPSPSPAVGYASVHAIQQRELVEQALGGDGSAS
ncbi:MAG: 2-oxoglutarate dehydrogenase E1 component [Pseudomonadota bacterium]